MEAPDLHDRVVFDFAAGAEPWPSIDDPVMGGRSRSVMRVDGGVAVFEGTVSLANGGGFASSRSRPAAHDLGIKAYRGPRAGG